jgi:hypothetical protein
LTANEVKNVITLPNPNPTRMPTTPPMFHRITASRRN